MTAGDVDHGRACVLQHAPRHLDASMRKTLSIAACFLAVSALRAEAQTPAPSGDANPVIACASLANLRAVLRDARDDTAAAIPAITDPKSDLGCNVLDRTIVRGIADRVTLNGRAYECLTLDGTSVCRWIVAGAAPPTSVEPARQRPASAPAGRTRR